MIAKASLEENLVRVLQMQIKSLESEFLKQRTLHKQAKPNRHSMIVQDKTERQALKVEASIDQAVEVAIIDRQVQVDLTALLLIKTKAKNQIM